MTTVHDRFTVDHEVLGFIDSFLTLNGAMEYAHNRLLREPGLEVLYIFDRMAHKGQPQLWSMLPSGTAAIVEHREKVGPL